MIDIKRGRYVSGVAQLWLDWVHDYFFTIKVGNKQPWLMVAGRRHNFNSYAEKLFYQLESKIKDYARGNNIILHRGKFGSGGIKYILTRSLWLRQHNW